MFDEGCSIIMGGEGVIMTNGYTPGSFADRILFGSVVSFMWISGSRMSSVGRMFVGL